ncbi:uncharacterized protein UV8b_03041 [Ustilaginoidea virens]|uniref:Zn(2)-C6 fungal-type domain-containing protein n=1 Tax=Ustilaginoidea virens TaxID=1159556 RepID=A0A8E5HNM3_USTVR|nr:uncharacterized protein UV8b_03041 [Ustilaginoidea virens]QUC18800.1 hypothetical protein UV8b_03041 [Ustilaginoidea virens]
MCRTRRIKCDETKPTCNQCSKSRRICPGYKDEFDLVFRNETQATERRARRATKKSLAHRQGREADRGASPSPSSSSSSSSDSGCSVSPTTPNSQLRVSAAPQIPLEDQAACHFISNYVQVPRHGSLIGFMEFVVPLLKAEKVPLHYQYAFQACGLASLNNGVGNRNHFEKQALGKYTKALSTTFAALRDPEVAKEDATLAAVLLLGLFENITAKTMGMLAWGSHIEGAIQLAKARGRQQLRTKVGLNMFIAVRTQMIIHSLSTSKAPTMDTSWWIEDAVRDRHATECQRLCIKVGELRSEANRLLTTVSRTPDSMEIVIDMIRRCQAQDQACASWCKNLPDYFQCKTATWEDNIPNGDYAKAEVYPGRVDVYNDLWVATVWNMLRCARIVLNSIIVRSAAWVCAPVDYRTTPEYANAARTTVDIITDVISSVPYQLGWFCKRKDLLDRANLSTFACGEDDSSKGLCGYFMTWPLALIQSLDYLTDSQRIWVRGRLEYIGSHLGVRYATLLTQLNIRIPSMLICRDVMITRPLPLSHELQKQAPANMARPTPSFLASPLVPQQETVEKAKLDKEAADRLAKALPASANNSEWRTKRWLEFEHLKTTAI